LYYTAIDTPFLDIVVAVTFILQVKVWNAFQCLATLSVVCYWGMSLLIQLLSDSKKTSEAIQKGVYSVTAIPTYRVY